MSLQEQQAKVSAAEQELANIRSQYDAIESQQKAASDAAERARANLLASGIDPATDENYQQLAQQSSQLSRQAQGLGNSLARARQNLAIANESLRREQQNQTIKNNATSSGAVVAAGDDAGVVNPAKKAERITPEGRIANPNPAGTNADAPVTNTTEQGATVSESQDRKISETQLPIKAPNQGEVKRLVDEPPPDPLTPPPGAYGSGVGSAGDDATPTKNLTRQDIELNFNEDIRPQPNILDKYATYTYQISWYLLNEADYRNVITRGRTNAEDTGIRGGQLLMQSGGENQRGGEVISQGTSEFQPSRNPYFTLDYYIDSLTMSNLFPGHATGSAHAYTDLKMTVVEPQGISLIDRLKLAVTEYCGIQAFQSAIYCLVIRWIGYDENGNIVYAGNTNSGGAQTDPYAIAIKYVPFAIKDIKFSVANRLTTYEISGVPVMYNFRLRQTVPYNTEITGKTVQEILGGSVSQGVADTEGRANTSSPTAGRTVATNAASLRTAIDAAGTVSASPTTGIGAPTSVNTSPAGSGNANRGLMNAMNEYNQQLVKDQIYEIADEFYIEFANPSIANAVVKKPGDLAIDKTPMGDNAPRNLLPDTGKVFNMYRNFGITAGQSVIQAIEMVIRNSSYIVDQQLKIIDEETQEEKPNGTPIETFAWFKVNLKAEPKGYDRKRNDYAYKFYFVISIYEVKSSNSVWFPRTRFRGVHKSYPYWFTGKNTSILDYQQSFDNLYVTVISGAGDTIQGDYTSALTDIPRFVYQPRSGQSSQGADQATNEPAANAADYLYSPTDLGTVKVKILGDPAWIQQGEIYQGSDPRTFSFSPFNADGGINFDSQEVLFEIVWQRPVDYDINGDGLQDPNRYAPINSTGANPRSLTGVQSYVFYATKCQHEFRQGRFEQTLDGGLYIFPRSKQTQINAGAANTGTGASGFPLASNPNSSGSGASGTGASGFPISVGQSSTSQQGKRVGRVKQQVKTGTGASGFPVQDSRVTLPAKPVNTGTDFATAYALRNRPGGPPKVQTTTPPIRGGREF
jgi:hypothetical protein